jgi:hypothetical protein
MYESWGFPQQLLTELDVAGSREEGPVASWQGGGDEPLDSEI